MKLTWPQKALLGAAFIAQRPGLEKRGRVVPYRADRFALPSTWEPLVARGLLQERDGRLTITRAGSDLHWRGGRSH